MRDVLKIAVIKHNIQVLSISYDLAAAEIIIDKINWLCYR